MALTPLKQRPATAYRPIPVPPGSILLVPNRQTEPGPEPGPTLTPPTAQWDVNTRGRTDNDFYEHVNGTVESSTGAPTVDTSGNYDSLLYNGTSQYTEVTGLPTGLAADFADQPYTMAVRLKALRTAPVDYENIFGAFQNTSPSKRLQFTRNITDGIGGAAISGGAGGSPIFLSDPDTALVETVYTFRRDAGGEFTFWVDGIQADASSITPPVMNPLDRIGFAARTDGDLSSAPWYFNGNIYWAAIWDSALPDEEVPLLSNTENPFSEVGPTPPPSSLPWNPGHWMQLNRSNDVLFTQASRLAMYDRIAAENLPIEGITIPVCWQNLEGAQGDYSKQSEYDTDVAYIKGLGYKVGFRLLDIHYGSSPTVDNTNYFPSYVKANSNSITNQGWLYKGSGSTGVHTNECVAACRSAWQGMMGAFAARYDDDIDVEFFILSRDIAAGISGITTPENWSDANHIAGWKANVDGVKAQAPNSHIILNMNYGGDQFNVELSNHLPGAVVGMGGPDVIDPNFGWETNPTPASEALQGLLAGTTDKRGIIPVIWSMEHGDTTYYNGPDSLTCQQIFDYADGTLRASHLNWQWSDNAWVEFPALKTEQFDAIRNNVFTYTELPSIYE